VKAVRGTPKRVRRLVQTDPCGEENCIDGVVALERAACDRSVTHNI